MRRRILETALAGGGALIVVAAVSVKLKLAWFWDSFHGSPLALITAGVAAFVLIGRALRVRERRTICWAAGLAVLVGIVEVIGASLWAENSFALVAASRGQIAKSLIAAGGYGLLTYAALVIAFDWLARQAPSGPVAGLRWSHRGRLSLAIWGLLVTVRLPSLIMYYPGITTPDSVHQLQMAIGEMPLTNHHPVTHTFIIKACVLIGEALDDLTLGVGLYSVFQIVATSGVVAFAVGAMMRWGYGKTAVWLAVAVWALYPIHSAYAVTMWKNVPFGFALLAWVVCLADVVQFRGRFFSRWTRWVPISLSGLGVILLGNNGFYVFLLSSLVFVVVWRGYRRQFAAMTLIGVTVFGLFTGPGFRVLGVEPGSAREALSVPLQFFAAVSRDHPDELTTQDRATIEGVLAAEDVREIGAVYRPRISDPVKIRFDAEWFAQHKGDFVRTWMSLIARYPGDAVQTFAVGGFGYWYPEVVYWTVSSTNSTEELGVERATTAEGFRAWLLGDDFGYDPYALRAVPVVGMASSIGFQVLLLVACVALLAVKRAWRGLYVLMPLAILWLTCLASPVFAEYRYAYGLVTCLPLILLFVYYQPAGKSRGERLKSAAEPDLDAGLEGQTTADVAESAVLPSGPAPLADGGWSRRRYVNAAVAIVSGVVTTIGVNLSLRPAPLMYSFTDNQAVLVLVAAGLAVLVFQALGRRDRPIRLAVGAVAVLIGGLVVVIQAAALGDTATTLAGSGTQIIKTMVVVVGVAILSGGLLSAVVEAVQQARRAGSPDHREGSGSELSLSSGRGGQA